MRAKPLPMPRCVAVDVDGTLIVNGKPNHTVLEDISNARADGYQVIVWSMRGRDYARAAAEWLGIEGEDVQCCSKPGVVIDDCGLDWLRRCRVVRC